MIQNAKLAQGLETDFHMNVDIECAWKGDDLFLLQCRPITTGKEISDNKFLISEKVNAILF